MCPNHLSSLEEGQDKKYIELDLSSFSKCAQQQQQQKYSGDHGTPAWTNAIQAK